MNTKKSSNLVEKPHLRSVAELTKAFSVNTESPPAQRLKQTHFHEIQRSASEELEYQEQKTAALEATEKARKKMEMKEKGEASENSDINMSDVSDVDITMDEESVELNMEESDEIGEESSQIKDESDVQFDIEDESDVEVDIEDESDVEVDVEDESDVQIDVENESDVQVDVKESDTGMSTGVVENTDSGKAKDVNKENDKDTKHTLENEIQIVTNKDDETNQSKEGVSKGTFTRTNTVIDQTEKVVMLPDQFNSQNFLRSIFPLTKVDNDALIHKRKQRNWVIDYFQRQFLNLGPKGDLTFVLSADTLYMIEKDWKCPKTVILYFFETSHPYQLVLPSVERRNYFFEMASLFIKGIILWCPNQIGKLGRDRFICVCRKDAVPAIKRDIYGNVVGDVQNLEGRLDYIPPGFKQRHSFMVSKLPYEIIDTWFGCVSLKRRPLPNHDELIKYFLPKKSHELYVISIIDIDEKYGTIEEINKLFLSLLGENYTSLVSSDKKKNVVHNKAMFVFILKYFTNRVTLSDSVEISFKKEQDGPDAYECVASAFKINESSLCFICVSTSTNSVKDTVRSSNIRGLLGSLPLGNTKLDISSRFDYLYIGGAFGYSNPFQEEDDMKIQMKKGYFLTNFTEEPVSEDIMKSYNQIRILYNYTPLCCKILPTSYTCNTNWSLPSMSLASDIYAQRLYLSCIAGTTPCIKFVLSNLVVTPIRVGIEDSGKLTVFGDWIDLSPHTVDLETSDKKQFAANKSISFFSTSHHADFIKLRVIRFMITGRIKNLTAEGPGQVCECKGGQHTGRGGVPA